MRQKQFDDIAKQPRRGAGDYLRIVEGKTKGKEILSKFLSTNCQSYWFMAS